MVGSESMVLAPDGAGVRGHLPSSDSGLRNRALQTRYSPSAQFSPHRPDDAEDTQEGDDMVVMQLGRIEEVCELDERPIRDRADDHARRPERDQDRGGSPPRLHETVQQEAGDGGSSDRSDGLDNRNGHRSPEEGGP